MVTNITTSSYLGFTSEELPAKGHAHNKALHISVKCQDTILSRVLLDTGSSLNIVPETTLMKLNTKRTFMKASTLVVKVFDGLRRMVIGEVDLSIMVGTHTLMITFQVMYIHPSYNCLLGRP